MTVAELGYRIDSSQAVTAKANLENMSAAATKAEAAQKRLSTASSASNAALAKIASGVDQANATLLKLSTLVEGGNASLVKLVATAEKTNTTLANIGSGSAKVVTGIGRVAPAADKSTKALNDNANAARLTSSQMLNLSRQGNDVITMFALGASPVQIFASQIGQVYGALEEGPGGLRGSLAAVGTAAKSAGQALLAFMVTPAGLAAGAGVAAVAGLATYIISTRKEVKGLDVLLKDHAAVLRGIGDIYGTIADKAKDAFSVSSLNGLQLSSSATQAGLGIQIANQTQGAMSDLGRFVSPGKSAGGFFSVAGEFQPFADAIEHLRKTAKDGTPDIIGFRKMVEDKWALDPNNAALTTSAGKLMDLTKDADAAARALKQLQIAQEALAKAVGPGGLPLRRGALSTDNMGAYEQYQAAGSVSASRAQQAFDAQRQGLFARSPAELAASARAQAGAQYNDNENPAERARRIDMAGQQAALAAQHALDEAQKDRKRSLDQTLASQQLDLDLIGKTSGAAEAMRMQFQLTQQLREEAARNNVPVDQQELELIKQKADAYGEMANQIARAQLGNDLAFERSQQFLTKDEQTIASRLRGTGIGMDSPEAGQMRDMTRFGEAKDMASGFLNGFKSELLNSGGNIGKALGTSILNALTNSMDKAWSKIFDQLATAFASALTGQKPGGSGLASAGTSVVGSILGGANDNYAPGAVTRAPLAAVGSGGVAAQAWNFFKSKGLADHQVAGILGNISAESAFKPTAIGDAGNAFGLFQHNDRAPQLLSAIGGKGNLGDVQGQLDFAWKELNSSESGALARLKAAPDVRSATAAFAGFERPRGFSLANPEGADNFSGRLSGAEQALDKFGGTAAKATGSLGSLGEGMGKMGSALSQFPTAPGGGGGGGGLLGSLFGGLSSAFSGTKAFSFLSSNPGGYVNFYADGTENAPEGWAWVGERGPELKKLRSGDVIRSNPASMQMAANQNRGQSQGKVELHVHVTGASGDDHVRTLAKQGAQEAIGEYHQGQVNGGFGDTQRRYTSQKG